MAILLWLSSEEKPAAAIGDLCEKNGFIPVWLKTVETIDTIIKKGKPVALAWDLENSRPGDWSIVQKLRSFSQLCQIPLLLFHENIIDSLSGGGRITNVLLKPVGKQMVQHVLNLLPQAMQRGEIWVIDDDPQALNYYKELISASLSDYHIRTVHGGREALSLLKDQIPDLVLLDLMMPDVDGFQILEHLRSNTNTALVPVIVITGKILTYDDVKRLDAPKVLLQTKGVLSGLESVAEMQRVLIGNGTVPQPTGILVKQACAYIQQNFTRSFSLVELSESIGVSKSYLSRVFKMEMGISLWDYLNRFRNQKAKELLLHTEVSITEIAAQVGYEDVGYFSRVFRDLAGCTPRNYRQKVRKSTTS